MMHARPVDRFAGAVTCADGFEKWAILPDLRVAVHANAGWRDTCRSRFFYRRVTISTIETNISNMMLVAELHWLFAGNECMRHVIGTREFVNGEKRSNDDKERTKNCDSGKSVRTAVKDLRHPLRLNDLGKQSIGTDARW